MQPSRDLAIVLRSIPYEERHRIVTALTENHGQITALARNAIQSRRFGGALEPFAASEWHFVERPGADLYRVEQALIRRGFEGLRKDFDRLSMASALNELMLKLAPQRQPCPELFRLHSNALALLEEQTDGADIRILNAYLAKLLQWSGSQPRLQSCMGCQLPLEKLEDDCSLSCVIADAGWICPSCRSQATRHIRERDGQNLGQRLLRVSPHAILDFHLSLLSPIRQLTTLARASKKDHQELFQFLEALFVYHLPGFDKKPLKSLRFLDLESTVQPQADSHR